MSGKRKMTIYRIPDKVTEFSGISPSISSPLEPCQIPVEAFSAPVEACPIAAVRISASASKAVMLSAAINWQ